MAVDVVAICRDLLRIDTSNPGSTEERAAVYVADRLEAAGIPFEVMEPAAGPCSLFARHGGDSDHPGLAVHGHLDVVPAGDKGWTHDPFGGVEADGCLWGRGAVDMKDVVAMMLATQLSLAAEKRSPRRDLVFAYFADEERGGTLGSRWVVENRPDVFAGIDQAVGELGGFSVTYRADAGCTCCRPPNEVLLDPREIPGVGGHAARSAGPTRSCALPGSSAGSVSCASTGPPRRSTIAAFVRTVKALTAGLGTPEQTGVSALGEFGAVTMRAGAACRSRRPSSLRGACPTSSPTAPSCWSTAGSSRGS